MEIQREESEEGGIAQVADSLPPESLRRPRSDSSDSTSADPSRKRARVEPDEKNEAGGLPKDPFVEQTGDEHSPGETYGKGANLFEAMKEARRKEGGPDHNPWAPFAMSRHHEALSFKDKRAFFAKIDELPRGPKWQCEMIKVTGSEKDAEGNSREKVELVELWKRNPVDCIKELIANPLLAEHMRFRSERLYENEDRKWPIFSEMWTGEWWETIQELLPKGATVAPVILASDKTQLSNFSGNKSAWPVYLSIGNITKDMRHSPSAHATVLIGYIPVTKLECFPKAERPMQSYELFHTCMSSLLEPLIEAGKNGVSMVCADGFIRRVYPIVAAYVADHPEQCLVACTKESACPKCTVKPEQRGDPVHLPLRNPEQTLSLINDALHGWNSQAVNDRNIRPIKPFWKNLPHCNIFLALTPDILHQLHKGVFKDHVVKWTTA
ncbi:hypothetical protein BC835DRAFT_1311511, partial [Cytidiella melzeri]